MVGYINLQLENRDKWKWYIQCQLHLSCSYSTELNPINSDIYFYGGIPLCSYRFLETPLQISLKVYFHSEILNPGEGARLTSSVPPLPICYPNITFKPHSSTPCPCKSRLSHNAKYIQSDFNNSHINSSTLFRTVSTDSPLKLAIF